MRLHSSSSASTSVWVTTTSSACVSATMRRSRFDRLAAMGVVGDPALEVARLADIERVALGVEHAIDAGDRRQRAQRRADDRDAARQRAADRGLGRDVRFFAVQGRSRSDIMLSLGPITRVRQRCHGPPGPTLEARRGKSPTRLAGYPRLRWTSLLATCSATIVCHRLNRGFRRFAQKLGNIINPLIYMDVSV